MVHFFKKQDPRIPVTLFSGVQVKFTAVDRQEGIFATENQDIANELDKAIANHRGGVTRIDQDEFHLLNQKKTPDALKPLWREEMTKGSNIPVPNQVVSRVVQSDPVAAAEVFPTAVNTDSPSVNPVRPTAARR